MRDRFLRGEEFFHADDMKEVERLDGTGEDCQQPAETQSMRVARGGIRVVVGPADDDD